MRPQNGCSQAAMPQMLTPPCPLPPSLPPFLLPPNPPIQVGSILNFSLMYLLAPTGAGAAAGGSLLGRALGPEFLQRWGAPGGNMFEPGFPLHKRLVNFGYKGVVFAGIGLLAGIVGTSVSNGLLVLRWMGGGGGARCWSMQGVSDSKQYTKRYCSCKGVRKQAVHQAQLLMSSPLPSGTRSSGGQHPSFHLG
jgi:hypothetical protein